MPAAPERPADALAAPLERVLGAKTAKALHRAFGLHTAGDLLWHLPRRYAHRGELTPIHSLQLEAQVTIVAEVVETHERSMHSRRGTITEARITDGHGFVTLTFFNQPWRAQELAPGRRGVFAGRISAYRGSLQLAHPDYELFPETPEDAGAPVDAEAARRAGDWATRPIPIYPATASLPSWRIAQAVGIVLDGLGPLPEVVPAGLRDRRDLLGRSAAFEAVHRPSDDDERDRGLRTLRYEEAFVLQVALHRQRQAIASVAAEAYPRVPGGMLDRFDDGLPFPLTDGQREIGETIARELAGTHPMNRLLQGEVGSGKTLVALRAMLQVADAGAQAVLIAPTEVLAAQHIASLHAMLGHELWQRLMPQLITGSLPAKERRHAALAVAAGQARLVVGTHALLSDTTQFEHLGLVVIDEQHRFGVEQREALRAKGTGSPHVLMLTATPIPRTVAMTVFGDLDISSLHELPAGRRPVSSFVVPAVERPHWLERAWQRLAEEVARGRQGYVVVPAIGDEDAAGEGAAVRGTVARDAAWRGAAGSGAASAGPAGRWTVESAVHTLADNPATAHLRVAALHGRMKAEERARIMRDYLERRLDVLVATTVIEVGVNVPNASIMLVLDADRLGVAQLHQLRGRVGRGEHPSLALFVTDAEEGSPARARVEAVAATNDGFELAELDLGLRHEGDVLGASQSGRRSHLHALQVVRDRRIITWAHDDVADLVARAEAAAVGSDAVAGAGAGSGGGTGAGADPAGGAGTDGDAASTSGTAGQVRPEHPVRHARLAETQAALDAEVARVLAGLDEGYLGAA